MDREVVDYHMVVVDVVVPFAAGAVAAVIESVGLDVVVAVVVVAASLRSAMVVVVGLELGLIAESVVFAEVELEVEIESVAAIDVVDEY